MKLRPKDYSQWANLKGIIHNNFLNRPLYIHYKEGYVYHTYVGQNIGYEQDGKGWFSTRPVLVVTGFTPDLFLGVPLTTRPHTGKFYHKLETASYDEPLSIAILSQLRVYDIARIQNTRPIGNISLPELETIQKKIAQIIDKNLSPTG